MSKRVSSRRIRRRSKRATEERNVTLSVKGGKFKEIRRRSKRATEERYVALQDQPGKVILFPVCQKQD